MKRRILPLLLAVLTALSLLPALTGTASAAAPVKVTVDGKAVTFNSDLGTPYIDGSGRTMVPFRAVANFMPGVKVWWVPEIREARFDKKDTVSNINGQAGSVEVTLSFPIGSRYCWIFVKIESGGEEIDTFMRRVDMDTVSVVKGGRTYAPIRYLAESFNYTVGWDGATRTVIINNPHPDYWGAYFLQDEQAKGDVRVTSQSMADSYAREFLRIGTSVNDPQYSYKGTGTINGRTIWKYQHGNKAEFYVTTGGAVYYRSLGSTDKYTRW